MAKLSFQGHGSFRIKTDNNLVIYVDPYVGSGYDIPADIILVTHQHGDHKGKR
jgi:L-ascorbate metabolism protein UlaG (beta-lactamase superfamily)